MTQEPARLSWPTLREVLDWKEAVNDAVDDYLLNPCVQTVEGMERAIGLFCPEAWMKFHGHVAAIRREEIIFRGLSKQWRSRLLFATDWFLRFCTWSDKRWNDYFALRWLFRMERYALQELHRRCHMRKVFARIEAKQTVSRLLGDRQFHEQFAEFLIGAGCFECVELLGDNPTKRSHQERMNAFARRGADSQRLTSNP